MRLNGKVAIITGGASGFGAAFAERFCDEGAKVVIADVARDAGEAVVDALRTGGGNAVFIPADVSNGEQVAAVVAHAMSQFGRLDIIMNNAGIASPRESITEQSEAFFDKLFAINVKSVYLFCHYGVPALKAGGGGVIINTASTSALKPRPQNAAYAATKAAVLTLTKALAVELAPDNIRVNALTPVAAQTPLFMEFIGEGDKDAIADIAARIPLGRLCEPSDMAACATFLASDEAAFLTGISLPVDGGWTAS